MLFKSNSMNVLRKSGFGLILLVGFSTSVVAQNFNLLSEEPNGFPFISRGVGFTLNGVSASLTPSNPFADLNGNLANSNSPSDYYAIAQNSSATPNQLICDSYINLQGTVPGESSDSPPLISSGCFINFNVSSPVTADFELSNFNVSNAGVSYDGPTPCAGIYTDDPNFPQGNCGINCLLNPNQGDYSETLTFEPNYTYAFVVYIWADAARGAPGDSYNVSALWQEDMSLTIDSNSLPAPEPSSVPLLAIGLTALFQLRRLRRHLK
jgi:hypothetical protein